MSKFCVKQNHQTYEKHLKKLESLVDKSEIYYKEYRKLIREELLC